MTQEEINALELTIAASFIRANVLSLHEANQHAGLAIQHMRNAMAGGKAALAEAA